MSDLVTHLAPSMCEAIKHVVETGHTQLWLHRRSMRNHELVCMQHETWEDWVDFHKDCEHRSHP